MQKLITKEIDRKLRANGESHARGEDTSTVKPVLKLFNPCGAATWLITERDPEDDDILFGLCDLGFGCPELGSVRLSELESVRVGFEPLGIKIERDAWFEPEKTLAEYAAEARANGRIAA